MAIQKETLNQSLLALFNDKGVVDKFNEAGTPEGCYDIAKAYVPGISFEDFKKDMEQIYAYIEENKDGLLELNELDDVAGGSAVTDWICAGSAAVSAVAACVGIAVTT